MRRTPRRAPWRTAICLCLLAIPSTAAAAVVTAAADNARTAWYPNEPSLTGSLVAGGTFGQLFSQPVQGQVYGQPLYSNGVVFVVTEDDVIYGLDPDTGAVRWSRSTGTPYNAADLGCADLTPHIGITSTPVIDDSGTGTAYFVAKSYVSGSSGPARYDVHAVDLANGSERAGFPVRIAGNAQNNAGQAFDATYEFNRAGLLLLDGVVYVAFGSHCDHSPWQGWVAGVSTTGTPALKALWVSMAGTNASGAGIWQAGGGLVSDGSGRIFFGTGNGGAQADTTPAIPGSSPPASLGEANVRLAVNPDGTLGAADFFEPYNAGNLDSWDADLSSGAPIALPAPFGAGTATPNLLLQVGKQGRIYLLDRSNLGGYKNGTGAGDAAVAAINGNEGVWARPAVWPGDGGEVWFPTASGGSSAGGSSGHLVVYRNAVVGGKPSLAKIATSPDAWPFSSSGPVITSNGSQDGSAIAWLIKSTGSSGSGAQLIAYAAKPDAGGSLVKLYSSGTFTASKFNPPGVGPRGRLYVGTRDGHLIGFGAPIAVPLASTGVSFGTQTVGTTSAPQPATITASADVTITAISSTSGEFAPGAPSPALPALLHAGDALTFPVTFTPSSAGSRAGTLAASTNLGNVTFGLTGTGQLAAAHLSASRKVLDFGGLPVGGSATQSVTFTNDGGGPLTFAASTSPAAPFAATGVPAAGATLAPGATLTVQVDFTPTAIGTYADDLVVDAGAAGSPSVGLSGTASTSGHLTLTPLRVPYGNVAVGGSAVGTFTVTNDGGSSVTITKSKPPVLGPFTATTTLDEGSVVTAGTTLTESVTFRPSGLGATGDQWLITGNDSSGPQAITFAGAGVIPGPTTTGWQLNGASARSGSLLVLTPARTNQRGSAFWPTAVAPASMTVAFTSTIDQGSGADGLALVLADPAQGALPTSLGASGGGLGFSGIKGVAIALDTHRNGSDPSSNFVGITNGPSGTSTSALRWLATSTAVPALRPGTHAIKVVVSAGVIKVSVDGKQVISKAVTLPPRVLVGFSGSTSSATDRHAVSAVSITGPGAPATPTLVVRNAVVAPTGSPQAGATNAISGTCPNSFTTAALGNGGSATPALPGAVVGSSCTVSESAPTGAGWQTTVAVNGGAAQALPPGSLTTTFSLVAGANSVQFTNTYSAATQSVPPPSASGWQLNGTATMQGASLQLTPATGYAAGSAFYPTAVPSAALTAQFDARIDAGSGADGLTFVLADPTTATPASLGAVGGGLGFSGITGVAVALDTFQNAVNPSANFVGISDGPSSSPDLLHWLATSSSIPTLQSATHTVRVVIGSGALTVSIDGTQVLSQTVTLPPNVLIGFTAGTGGQTNAHTISNTTITIG